MEECGRFSPSTFMWIMELELQLPGLHALFFFKPLSHLAGPIYTSFKKIYFYCMRIFCLYVS